MKGLAMTEYDAQEIERSGKRWAAGIIIAIIAVVALLVWRSGQEEPDVDLNGDAKRVCQEEFIPKRLKAPATAEFSGVSVTTAGDTYTVTGSVDSQNSFGALVRSSFACVVRHGEDQWVLESANVDG